jgi:hypothetical protein
MIDEGIRMPANKNVFRCALLSIVASVWLAGITIPRQSAYARPVRSYTYAQLVSKSDAVVIAFARSTEQEMDYELDKELRGFEKYVECVKTSFQIDAVLKGDIKAENLSLLHYRFKQVTNPIRNWPGLVRFETQGLVYGKELGTGKLLRASAPKYLLFLKATADGKFVPVTGQLDPNDSVNRLEKADEDEPRAADPLPNAEKRIQP